MDSGSQSTHWNETFCDESVWFAHHEPNIKELSEEELKKPSKEKGFSLDPAEKN